MAREGGMRSLAEHALEKAARAETSLAEVLRLGAEG
jgi:type II secretory ATPase GspE/PulE/Tfp pilus assembly ATPase PilB-like protein